VVELRLQSGNGGHAAGAEIATIAGPSPKDVAAILDANRLGRDVTLADAAIRPLGRKENRIQSAKGA
jgi:hypothetical protein